jgi:hypothetical protein
MNSITQENAHNIPCDAHNNDSSGTRYGPLTTSAPPPVPEPVAECPTAPATPRERAHLDRVIAMIPQSAWERRFRANSFASKLTGEQMGTLRGWFKTLTIPQVQERVAAPAPDGFGRSVQQTTLRRLKKALEAEAPYWLADSLDTCVDLLASDEAGAIAPLREALSVMLYTRAIACCEQQADIPTIDRLLAAITKIEKLKAPVAPRSSAPSVPGEPRRHQVELSIVPPAQRQRAEIISVPPESLPSPE